MIPGIYLDDNHLLTREIVGVVGDVKHKDMVSESGAETYLPNSQFPPGSMSLVVRSDSNRAALISAIRGEVAKLDPDMPIYSVKTMDDYVSISIASQRFNSLLSSIFAVLALVLTAVGLYGVLAYTVSQRTREIGIRVALGAKTSAVFKRVVEQGMTVVLIGIGLGSVGGFLATSALNNLVFKTSAKDPRSFIAAAATIFLVGILACCIPAWRAAKVDPMTALRYE